jgi:serine/threonine-protein phosphatase 2A activator
MKKGPFGEHSPYLNDISGVPHQLWEKINNGMLRMYKDEVLNKFVVIQHTPFGTLFPFE